MAKAIGIDLGTTNSVAGLKRLETDILPNAEGEGLTPSVVGYQHKKGFFKSGSFVVGQPALDWMQQDPENTIVSVKRLMGRNFSDEEVQRMLEEQRYAYTVQALSSGSQHSVAVLLNGKEYMPEEISAKILQKIKTDSEQELGETVDYAVVTVPAYFNDKQKHATRIAAAQAGLKVQRLLPEPTAAAISFGVDALAEGEANTILVFDLGGGTFDISILTIADGQFIEQGKGGDMWMGGDDIDALITRFVYRETERDNDIDSVSDLIERLPAAEKNRFMGDLKRKVEVAKIELSSKESAFIEILGLLKDDDGDIVDIDVELSRARFEELLQPFVDQCVELTQQIIESIDFEPELIDKVVMVGGSSCIPLVIRRIKELFGEDKVLVHQRAMLAIAEGAAILAHRLADFYECPACGQEVAQADQTCPNCHFDLLQNLTEKGVVDIVHTTSHDYFLELEDGRGHLLVEKNTPLPFTTQATFKLVHPEQQLAHFKFYNTVNQEKESIGDLWLAFDRPEEEPEEKIPEVQLDFEVDVNNIISVSAALAGQEDVRLSRTLSRGQADEKLFLGLERSIAQVNEEKHNFYINMDFLHRSVNIARGIHQVIDPDTGREDMDAAREVERQQRIANEVVEKNESVLGNLYYADSFADSYGRYLKEKDRKKLEVTIQRLKEKSEHGSLPEMLTARKALNEELDKYPALLALGNLEHAASLAARENPAKAPRYEKYLHDAHGALLKGDQERFIKLLNEIMPEVQAIRD
ncbi:MAG: Hsp70 family protein, partial [Pseudomonadota bacterium]